MQLGDLEKKVMGYIWQTHSDQQFTVRHIVDGLNSSQDQYAYNTLLTVITHLRDKKLLRCKKVGKTGVYSVRMSKSAYVQKLSRDFVQVMQLEYGDLAVAHFVDAVDDIDPALLRRAQQSTDE